MDWDKELDLVLNKMSSEDKITLIKNFYAMQDLENECKEILNQYR
ncbi:hypothetical protein [Apilactobacillus apisilvae]|nr:hypothetical protein [Apilactobacillus apisilvae]